jgi:hypothetical protein
VISRRQQLISLLTGKQLFGSIEFAFKPIKDKTGKKLLGGG